MPRKRRRSRKSKQELEAAKAKWMQHNKILQEITSLHSNSIGFANNQDWQECLDIHLVLLKCTLIQKFQGPLNQNILKEIATYATGQTIDCKICKLSFCMLWGNTVDSYALGTLCSQNNLKIGLANSLAGQKVWTSEEMELAKTIFNSDNDSDKIGYLEVKFGSFYICSHCFPNELVKAWFCNWCQYPIFVKDDGILDSHNRAFHKGDCHEIYVKLETEGSDDAYEYF